jgi:hypothetical protein
VEGKKRAFLVQGNQAQRSGEDNESVCSVTKMCARGRWELTSLCLTEGEKLVKRGSGDSEWLNKAGMWVRVQTSRQ